MTAEQGGPKWTRPLQRPAKPYTLAEMRDAMARHFINGGGIRCNRSNETGNLAAGCKYGDVTRDDGVTATGCGVGFMLTADDAAALDGSLGSISAYALEWDDDSCQVLAHYFDLSNPAVYLLLRAAQRAHDCAGQDSELPERFRQVVAIFEDVDAWMDQIKIKETPICKAHQG